jgi:hypothetical protein
MRAVPREMPGLVRRVVQRIGRRGADRFLAAYQTRHQIEQADLDWFIVLHSARLITMVETATDDGPRQDVVSGWRQTLPLLAQLIAERTD